MAVEAATSIEDLDDSWPLSGDPTSQGDDHIRLIKSVLKTQFPGLNGNGFEIPLSVNEYELNFVDGATKNIPAAITALEAANTASLTALYAPVGTRMVFCQAAAPTGWTQVTDYNDYMLRVVATAGGGVGGSDSPISKTWNHTHTTGSHTLTLNEIPSHNHGAASSASPFTSPTGAHNAPAYDYGAGASTGGTSSVGGSAAHNHGITGSTSLSFTPKYLNAIIARKT